MKILKKGTQLKIQGIKELNADNCDAFRDQVQASIQTSVDLVEIDFSRTTFVDSCGLGALIALYKTVENGETAHPLNQVGSRRLRILNPTLPVQKIFELTRLHKVFEIDVQH